MEPKPLLQLWQMSGLGLIIARSSGVVYTNQTGGYCCLQSEQEGVFVPLLGSPEGRDVDPERLLKEHFTGPKWMGGCANGIDEESASFIDGLLHRMRETRFLTVDRSRLHDSHEAWVYVDIADQPLEPVTYGSATNLGLTDTGQDEKDSGDSNLPMPAILNMIFGFGPSKGVLTWSNSD